MDNNDLMKDVATFAAEKQKLIERLRGRLGDLDTERQAVSEQLRLLESPSPTNGAGKHRDLRSDTAKLIMKIIGDRESGMTTKEVIVTVQAQPGKRGCSAAVIGTYLSRLRKKGLLHAKGEPGYFRYQVAPKHE